MCNPPINHFQSSVQPLHLEEQTVAETLQGWRSQFLSRNLAFATIDGMTAEDRSTGFSWNDAIAESAWPSAFRLAACSASSSSTSGRWEVCENLIERSKRPPECGRLWVRCPGELVRRMDQSQDDRELELISRCVEHDDGPG